jgi:predicted phage terminase large subunit-like protein
VQQNTWIKKERIRLPDGTDWYGPLPKQQHFLLHTHTREVFYGGAGGGGKSQALWYGALQYVDTPGYAALILRRSYVDLARPGALMDRSKVYLAGTAAVWNATDKRWTFPSGATITFGYLEKRDDHLQYASAELQYIAFDELTHFAEYQYTFLFSRLRRLANATVPTRMRSASNPGGPGHDWVKERFVDSATRKAGRVFVPAKVCDNPAMDMADYRANLANTDPLTRQQIEDGDWDAVAGGRFAKTWFRRYAWRGDYLIRPGKPPVLLSQCRRFGTCDPAASVKTSADYTVVSAWAVTPDHDLIWLDCVRQRLEVPDIVPAIEKLYAKWNLSYVGIEGGGTQQGVYQAAKRTKMIVKELRPEATDKLAKAMPAILLAESGRIYLPQIAAWCETCLAELCRFTGDDKIDSHDDVVDTVGYAAAELRSKDDEKRTGFKPYVMR